MFTKIDELLWKDKKFKKLKDDAKILFVYLLSCQHRNVLGMYSLPKYYIMGDLNFSMDKANNNLEILIGNKFIEYDTESEVVLVNNFLKHNPLDNYNQVKGAAKTLPTIPKTQLFFKLVDILKDGNIKQSENLVKALKNYIKNNGFEEEGVEIETIPKTEDNPKIGDVETTETSSETNDKKKVTKKKGKKVKKFDPKTDEYTELYEKVYDMYPLKQGKRPGMINFYKRLENYSEEQLINCIKRYKKYLEKEKISEKFYVLIYNFFGTKAYFEDYLEDSKDVETSISNDCEEAEIDRLHKKIQEKQKGKENSK